MNETTNEDKFTIAHAIKVGAAAALIGAATYRTGMKIVNWNERRKIDYIDIPAEEA